MLEKLVITDFQAHEKLVLKFGPGVTTLIGRTDRGKSAVIRAVSALALNSPSGAGVVRHGAEKFRIALLFDGFVKVVRTRGEKVNAYSLSVEGDVKSFAAFGTKVPEPIADALRIGEDNFQFQFDGHYWFSETASAVGKRLNGLVDLELIDDMMSEIASNVRSSKAKVGVLKEQLETAVAKVEKLRHAPDALEDLEAVEGVKARLDKTAQKREILRSRLVSLARVQKGGKLAGEAAESGVECLSAGDSLIANDAKQVRLKSLLRNLAEVQRVSKLPCPDNFDEVLAVRVEADKVAESHRLLRQAVERYEIAAEESETCRRELESLQKELAKFPTCPSCKRPLESSPSASPISTSHSHPPSLGGKRKTGG
jgi:predicted  nucleic acid-binding Zn-ribbon protein